MTQLCTLASGSGGNAVLFSHNDTHILIDAGISAKRIKERLAALDLSIDALSGLLITHTHSDHTYALKTLLKHYQFPIFASDGSAAHLKFQYSGISDLLVPFSAGDAFSIGSISIRSFSTSHDAGDSVCYRMDTDDGAAGILTDTGIIPEHAQDTLAGVTVLLLEANHDVETLQSGPYSASLKERILSERGHLSNDAAAAFASREAESGTRDIILAHLSEENNTPAMAYNAVRQRLDRCGYSDVMLSVAPRDAVGPVHQI